jgi:hypothetical protein
MTIQPEPSSRFSLRSLSNVLAVIALVLAVDWGFAWLRGTPTYACAAGDALGTDGFLTVAGMGGLVLAIVGITLGGVRHPMTGFGLLVVMVGLLGGVLASEAMPKFCQ